MSNRMGVRLNFAKKVALVVAGTAALGAPIVLGMINAPLMRAQSRPTASSPTTAKPQFEVASIKPCKDVGAGIGVGGRGGSGNRSSSPGRLEMPCQTVRSFIQVAYIRTNFRLKGGIANLKLEGGPAWIDSELYQISAKAEGPASQLMMDGPMLQALLEDRFRLKTHRETREAQVYEMTVAKSGLKYAEIRVAGKFSESADRSLLARANAENCIAVDPTQPLPPFEPGQKPPCGGASMTMSPYRITFDMPGGNLTQFAQNIGGRLGRPVVDKTGIKEKFDFHVEFAPEGADLSDERTAPSIFEALGELGLKLAAARGPRDFLVIDRVERPSKN